MNTADVIIVGGGVSGLCAAAALEAAGLTCILLEGRSRLGGRVCASPSGIDLGAQWIHGHQTNGMNPLYDLARKAHLPLKEFDYDNVATFDAKGKLVGDREVDAWEGEPGGALSAPCLPAQSPPWLGAWRLCWGR